MFRCKACGHLVPEEHAGECEYPHACPACGAGISYNPQTGAKVFNTENWEVLSKSTRIVTGGVDVGKTISVETKSFLGIKQS